MAQPQPQPQPVQQQAPPQPTQQQQPVQQQAPPVLPPPTMASVLAEMPNGGQGQDPEDDELFAQYNTRLQVVKEE